VNSILESHKTIHTLAIGLVALFLVACGGDSSSPTGTPQPSSGGDGDGTFGTVAPPPSNTLVQLEIEPTAGGHFLDQFPFGAVLETNVGKDGIPALTNPRFVGTNSVEATYLRDSDLVLGLVVDGEAKAYPHNILWWHEIINDIVGGSSVCVTLCPLTGTGMVFNGDAEDGSRIELGVSGRLINNNLIMYDRRDDSPDETNYPQMTAKGISGRRRDDELELMPVVETTWRYWKQLYPNTTVVSDRTGYSRSYVSYPYGSYRNPEAPPQFTTTPSLIDNSRANLLDWKQIAMGIRFGEIAKAYPIDNLGSQVAINDDVDGNPILVIWHAAERMIVPFSRIVDGQTLTFEQVSSSDPVYPYLLRDMETGTQWNLKGESLPNGALSGNSLQQLPAHNSFWFAWTTFWQNTGVY